MSFRLLFVIDLMFFSIFEPAKIQIISMCDEKSCFFAKNISLCISCLFVLEYLFLPSDFSMKQ